MIVFVTVIVGRGGERGGGKERGGSQGENVLTYSLDGDARSQNSQCSCLYLTEVLLSRWTCLNQETTIWNEMALTQPLSMHLPTKIE